MEFKKYSRKGLSEMRPYVKGESLESISVSKEDDPESDMGMVARNPKNHDDQWYVARKYFEDNLEEAKESPESFSAKFVNHMMSLVASGDKAAGMNGKFEVTHADRVNWEG